MSEARVKELEARLKKAQQRLDYYRDDCESLRAALAATTRDQDKFFGRKQLSYGGIYLHGLLSQIVESVLFRYSDMVVIIFWRAPNATSSEGKLTLIQSRFRFESLIKELPLDPFLLPAWERDVLRAAFLHIFAHETDESLRDVNGLPFYELRDHEEG